jgi:hypothetical protein
MREVLGSQTQVSSEDYRRISRTFLSVQFPAWTGFQNQMAEIQSPLLNMNKARYFPEKREGQNEGR